MAQTIIIWTDRLQGNPHERLHKKTVSSEAEATALTASAVANYGAIRIAGPFTEEQAAGINRVEDIPQGSILWYRNQRDTV